MPLSGARAVPGSWSGLPAEASVLRRLAAFRQASWICPRKGLRVGLPTPPLASASNQNQAVVLGGSVLARRESMRSALKVALATGAFAVVHSLLATTSAKDAAATRFRFGRELYRVAYNAQAVITFGALVWFIARQPERTLYRVRGPLAGLLRLGQLGGVAWAIAAARATGVATLAGADNLLAVLTGMPAKQPPAAQGPEMDEAGALRIRGPFTLVRHPLNVAPLAPFWLTPHMTTRRLAFNIIATGYLVIGSLHEEKRLRHQYGEAYQEYQRNGTPFFLPSLASQPVAVAPNGGDTPERGAP